MDPPKGSEKTEKLGLVPVRLLIVTLAIMCPALCYFSRQNISLAINAMANDTDQEDDEQVRKLMITYGPKYFWSQGDQMKVLAAFFYSYVICQIPTARSAEIFGAKWVLLVATVGSCVCSALSPWAASVHVNAFFVVRLLMGVCQSALFPTCYNLLTQWLPIRERLRAFPFLNLSAYLGSIVAIKATAYFAGSQDFGWEYAFYTPAGFLAIWSILWTFIGSSRPQDNKFISQAEIDFIERTRGDVKVEKDDRSLDWCKLLSSSQIWGIIVSFFTSNWSFSLILMILPTYLRKMLKVPYERNANTNAGLYLTYSAVAPLVGLLSTRMVTNKIFNLSRTQVRKIFESIATLSQAVCFVLIVRVGLDWSKVELLLYIQMIFYTFVNGGEVSLPTEVSAEFGGTIYGIANTVGSSTGFIIPVVCSALVTDADKMDQWNNFMYTAAGVSVIGTLIFLILIGTNPEDFTKDSKDKVHPSQDQSSSQDIELSVNPGSKTETTSDI